MKSHYYIHRVSCKVHNKKTQALNDALARFNFTLVEFSETFTPADMFTCLRTIVREVNTKGKSREIEVRKDEFSGTISFTFYEVPNNGEAVASFSLYPVLSYIKQ